MKSMVVCIRDRDGRVVCGTPVHSRENPSPATALAALRYRRQPEVLNRLRGATPSDQTLDEALEFLEAETGERQQRDASLITLSEYVRNNFNEARDALRWLVERDRRLSVWCAAQVARSVLNFVPAGEQRPLQAIEAAEGWVRGAVTIETVKKASNAAFDFAFSAVSSPVTSAASAAATAAAAAFNGDAAFSATFAAGATDSDRRTELQRLVGVVADAILTFPEVVR
jgi:hypothetical protein